MEQRLTRYLDGALPPGEREAFEREVAADPALAQEVALQREIDEAIRRRFPARDVSLPAARSTRAARPHSGRRWAWYGAIAAVLVLSAIGVRTYFGVAPEFKVLQPDTLYAILETRGWTPEEVCTTPQEFAALVKSRLGKALVPATQPGVTLLGWGYSNDYDGSPLSPSTIVLLAEVEGSRVMVLMDRAGNDRTLSVRPERGLHLHLHRREVGGLVTYEVSPLPEPRVIPLLSPP